MMTTDSRALDELILTMAAAARALYNFILSMTTFREHYTNFC